MSKRSLNNILFHTIWNKHPLEKLKIDICFCDNLSNPSVGTVSKVFWSSFLRILSKMFKGLLESHLVLYENLTYSFRRLKSLIFENSVQDLFQGFKFKLFRGFRHNKRKSLLNPYLITYCTNAIRNILHYFWLKTYTYL